MTLTVPCLFGLESLVADEMRRLNLKDVRAENGRVHCDGTLADIARLNINLRCGARVLMELGSFPARDFEALFQGQLCRQLSLLLNGIFYRLPAFLQPPEVLETLFQRAERRVVHGAVKLLTVTGNKGNGIALVQQANHVFHILRFFVKLLGKRLNDIHSRSFRSGNLK